MARRSAARKAHGERAAPHADAESRLVDAALTLAARQGWRTTGLAEIAAEAGLPLQDAYAACPSKEAILAALNRRIDRAALAGTAEEGRQRDRLFDLLMRRFDALQPHKAALGAILRDSFGDPLALMAMPALARSMAWMLEAAGISSAGWGGRLRVSFLTGLYLWVLRIFLKDESADLARTMAALDRGLRRAESWLGTVGDRRGGDAESR
jgi:AcrR family transcriptional regulator